ncbi:MULTISPECIES: acyl-CoA dehydrogenase family protein [Novosphingobium]|uniref:acyl-CoA dehydrogenase family protein n=1 Tax=Novosphingobium TaxID=165696 RepID=UPI000AD02214|nr:MULTISPECIES: acyl-CoA dehydrogenase family protein [Novosphingobium]PTR07664.1 alkylation response protein AidB-like acyl-CoA dehydrogenase [Novosphingobium sp. GV055]PUB00350.1 alkylation response protein AidB-like acyl-CoA dehydrogenase [Novosphingobium sp. GV061]PUB15689.1 alkylation response protein AidB-like acyl-CoA dehydrogenase [Novosphingobium sp. GV079]PUB39376.1 alkylation response protein AidB-like acyl-CoA dehydrogenase [Novosphingobium sp. GV027]WQD95066.1 acyl-CoA dehydrogen
MNHTLLMPPPDSHGVATDGFGARIEQILPQIAAGAAQGDERSSLHPDSIAALTQAGVFRALVPAMYGGDEVDFIEFLAGVRRLAAVCPASGWIAGVVGTHSHGISYYGKQAQDDIWADGPDTRICSSFAPVVTAQTTEGGYLLTGAWDFSSGCDHAAWAQLGFRVEGMPGVSYLGLIPRSDFNIVDNWDTVGMRATGSKRVEVRNVFVPQHRCWGPGMFAPPAEPGLHDHWLFRMPFLATAANFGAVLLGAADGALAAYRESVQKRIRPHTGKLRMDNPLSFIRLAESHMEIRAASALVTAHWQGIVDHAKAGTRPAMDEVLRSRGDEAFAGRMIMNAVDRLLAAAGGSATFKSRPLQRYWRDIHTAGNHMFFDLENRLVIVGRHLVGLEPDPDLL